MGPILAILFGIVSTLVDTNPLAVGGVAPDHGIESWVGDDAEASKKVVRSDEKSARGKPLAELHGHVVFLLALRDVPDPESVRVVVDLLRANDDREVRGLGLVPTADLGPALRGVGFDAPIGVPGEQGSPYLTSGGEPGPHLTVVGRSGEIVWTGDPGKREKDLLAACHAALLAWPAPALERDLDEELADATADYFAGRWARARKAARKVAGRAKRAELAEDAGYLAERIDELEHGLLDELQGIEGSWHNLRLLRLHRALARGFPKSPVLEECETVLEGRRKRLGAGSLLDETTWIELEDQRPVLFPLRKDAAGKKFAKKIGKLVRNANDTELTRLVREMLQSFETR